MKKITNVEQQVEAYKRKISAVEKWRDSKMHEFKEQEKSDTDALHRVVKMRINDKWNKMASKKLCGDKGKHFTWWNHFSAMQNKTCTGDNTKYGIENQ